MANITEDKQAGTMVADHPGDELPTSHLTGLLEEEQSASGDIDWVSSLSTTNFREKLEEAAPSTWEPSGMAQHTAAPKMVPTIGARLSGGLKKSFVVVLLALLSAGAIAAAAYGLSSTEWFAGVLSPQPATPIENQPKPQQQALPDVAQGGDVPVIEAPLSGSATQLRDDGIAEYKKGNIDEAIRLLEGSIYLNSKDAISYHQLGLAYLIATNREHALEDAEMAFRSAASLQPDWAAPQQGLAESLIRRNYFKDAIAPALEATRLDPTLGEAWMTLGRAYHGNGQEAEATRAFAEAARNSPPPLVVP